MTFNKKFFSCIGQIFKLEYVITCGYNLFIAIETLFISGEYSNKIEIENKDGFLDKYFANPKIVLAVLVCIYIVQLIFCIYLGSKKQALFCDEIYTYGLANSEQYTFFNDIGLYKIFHFDTFQNYITSSPNRAFHFRHVYINQANDVHPPLYYYLIHIVSAFSGSNFTIWTGIGLNLFFLIFADLLIYYVAREFLKSPPKAIYALILWSFCAAGLSNILLIRMYLMLTVEIFAYIAVHILMLKHFPQVRFKDYFLLVLTFVAGGLTHYYFYVFAFIFSFFIGLYLIIKKNRKDIIFYVISLALGLIINSICFVETWEHVFGSYRGVEFFENISSTSEYIREALFSQYFGFINDSTGPYILPAIFIMVLIITLNNMLTDKIKIKDISENIKASFLYIITVITTLIFAFIVIKASSLIYNRYIYPIYPILAITAVWGIFYILKFIKKSYVSYIIAGLIIISMCCTSIHKYGIEHEYPGYKKVRSILNTVKGYDCLIYIESEEWWDIYSGLNEKAVFDEIFFFDDINPDLLETTLKQRKTDNPIAVILPSFLSEDFELSMVNMVSKRCKYKNIRKLYDYPPFPQVVYVIE